MLPRTDLHLPPPPWHSPSRAMRRTHLPAAHTHAFSGRGSTQPAHLSCFTLFSDRRSCREGGEDRLLTHPRPSHPCRCRLRALDHLDPDRLPRSDHINPNHVARRRWTPPRGCPRTFSTTRQRWRDTWRSRSRGPVGPGRWRRARRFAGERAVRPRPDAVVQERLGYVTSPPPRCPC